MGARRRRFESCRSDHFSTSSITANQRTKHTLANGVHWDYTYDNLGQVTAGRKRWVDNAPVAGQQFEYAFDEIGNRLSTKAGGDAAGGNLRFADYDVNALNQYERRDVPAAIDVIGAAPVASVVKMNEGSGGGTAERRGAYYRKELSTPNSTGPNWQTVEVDVDPQGSVDKTGHVFVPKTPEVFTHDADGNLTQDGRWNYTWDAENRLIKMASRNDTPNVAPTGSEKCLVFDYDYRGRRIGKKVWNNIAGSGAAVLEEFFLYDGWNLAAVINSSSAITKFFVWGLDLSGTMQGAGGVGGLLWGRFNALIVPQFMAYDGNGNVSALVSGSTGSALAQYEYGPFGELIRASGTMGKNNPFRFSTKYQDDETDQLYYGYRFFNASLGRWLSRDPIGELVFSTLIDHTLMDLPGYEMPRVNQGGIFARQEDHQYTFISNDPASAVDILGLYESPNYPPPNEPMSGWDYFISRSCPTPWDCKLKEQKTIETVKAKVWDAELKVFVVKDWPSDVSCTYECVQRGWFSTKREVKTRTVGVNYGIGVGSLAKPVSKPLPIKCADKWDGLPLQQGSGSTRG